MGAQRYPGRGQRSGSSRPASSREAGFAAGWYEGWVPLWTPPLWEAPAFGPDGVPHFPGYYPPPPPCFPHPRLYQGNHQHNGCGGCGGHKGSGAPGGRGRGRGRLTGASSWQGQGRTHPERGGAPAGSLEARFREDVLILRRARNAAAVEANAKQLWLLFLEAEEADAVLDGPLLGMAAANCVRLRQPELLEAICAYAGCRLASFGGREVAEMASAAMKLERLSSSFVRALAEYCASPPGAFKSVRDISQVATVLFQSLKAASVNSAVEQGPGFRGLAEAAQPMLADGSSVALRDAVELAHALAHACEACPLVDGAPMHKNSVVEAALCGCLNFVRQGLHGAVPMDVAMVAGAAAAAWGLLPQKRGTVLQPVLQDSASAARFRRGEFSLRDLALIAGAFAKTGVVSEDLAGVLNERTKEHMDDLSNRDVCFFLWAASQVETWSEEPFAVANVLEVLRRDASAFTSHDLTTLATALARLGELGHLPLERVLDEAFRRQLLGFLSRDRAALLAAAARAEGPKALVRLLVRGLAGDCAELERDAQCQALWALARLWHSLPATDPAPQVLAEALCTAKPWEKASPSELADCTEALALLPGRSKKNAWATLLEQLGVMDQERFSMRELLRLMSNLARCEAAQAEDAAGQRRELFDSFAAGLQSRLEDGETPPEDELRALATQLGGAGLELPTKVAELVARVGASEPCAEPAPSAAAAWAKAASEKKEKGSRTTAGEERADAGERKRGSRSVSFDETADVQSVEASPRVVFMAEGLNGPPGLGGEREHSPEPWPPPAARSLAAGPQPSGLPLRMLGQRGGGAEDELAYDFDEERPRHHFCGSIGHHGHSHGHGHHAGRCAPCSPVIRPPISGGALEAALEERGHGHGHEIGHGHGGHGHGGSHEDGSSGCCTRVNCCPSLRAGGPATREVRLNRHCDFPGHCVQLKHTFLHIPCSLHDSDSETDDCFVCHLTRTRSASSI